MTLSSTCTIVLLILFQTSGCVPAEKKTEVDEKQPPSFAYDLTNPDKFSMPERLFEISGITFNQGNPDTIYAVQDEEGRLFKIAYGVRKQNNTKFGTKGDYEDVAILNERFVILKSNGTLLTAPLSEAAFEVAEGVTEVKSLVAKGEYEAMYGDEKSGNLYILCKNCTQDKDKESVSGFILHLGETLTRSGTFRIHSDEINEISGKVARGFRPSGLANNPLSGEWFIISAVNKLLVVTDQNWKVKAVQPLNGNVFTQPEGIAFDKQGTLYISNEGDDFSDGNILKFKRK